MPSFIRVAERTYLRETLYSTNDKTYLNQGITRWYIGKLVLLLISTFLLKRC